MKVRIMFLMFVANMFAIQNLASDVYQNEAGTLTLEERLCGVEVTLCCVPVLAVATGGFAAGAVLSASGSAAQTGLAVGAGVCGCVCVSTAFAAVKLCCPSAEACGCCFAATTNLCCACCANICRCGSICQGSSIQETLPAVRQVPQQVMKKVPASVESASQLPRMQ